MGKWADSQLDLHVRPRKRSLRSLPIDQEKGRKVRKNQMTRKSKIFGLALTAALATSGSACLFVLDDDCGPNAYHHRHECFCFDGYVGDPYDYCERSESLMTFELIDQCNDNLPISWRLVSGDGTWQWPEQGTYTTTGYGILSSQDLYCTYGEQICFGGAAGANKWGCGLDQPTCTEKCFTCDDVTIDLGALSCL
jgi:hypothetical protein